MGLIVYLGHLLTSLLSDLVKFFSDLEPAVKMPFIGQVLSVMATSVGAFILWRRLDHDKEKFEDEKARAEVAQAFEQFNRAIEQLGSEELQIRLGAIYLLEQIAKDFKKLHWPTIEVLSAFIRNSPEALEKKERGDNRKADPVEPSADVKAAFIVICRRNSNNDPEGKRLDLRGAVLNHVEVEKGAQLRGAWLDRIQLQYSFMKAANFEGSILVDANLSNSTLHESKFNDAWMARLIANETQFNRSQMQNSHLAGCKMTLSCGDETNLTGADMTNADLTSTRFFRANLENVRLAGANLFDASLLEADVSNASLAGVKGLLYPDSCDFILDMKNWRKVMCLPNGFKHLVDMTDDEIRKLIPSLEDYMGL